MRSWLKLLPFFIVCWIARRNCSRMNVGGWVYVQPFGPGHKHKPEPNILIEVDVAWRTNWYGEVVADHSS